MSLSPAESFDRYVIEERLGEGAVGEVYRAMDTRLRRKIALKVLRRDPEMESEAWDRNVARMLREARAAAALTHPNIVAVYDVGEHEGVPFIAMELVAGKTLRSSIGRDISQGERIELLLQVAFALAAAHAEGVVHRDVKPENVMVREDGVAKVLDFGIARRLPGGLTNTQDSGVSRLSRLTGDGSIVGTPAYMAPEQLLGHEIDARADQFSWGVMAFELMAGRLPFRTDGGGLGLVTSMLNDEPRPLEGAPEELAAIVRRTLSKSPDERFSSMEDLAEAVAGVMASVLPPPPPMRKKMLSSGIRLVYAQAPEAAAPAPEPPPPPRTNPILIVGAAALAVGLFIGGVLFLLQRSQAETPQAPAAPPPGAAATNAPSGR
ncbi:serine/threonine-protein kinase [Polyangium sorediatum]|uniref:Serine/threonine-protein kinase n=1 Tax=Polyangium sorediatum TaxID=889274 RepID=A0ABT6PBB4_9BACT|nr:serine/threonine-protein kinase [Polyangium sorediatum]MDI1437420.1 serine/threonine-protein kinase [Polyangium sorediatum]